jgi:hypothetical protein
MQESNSEVEVGNVNRTYSYDIIGGRSRKPKPSCHCISYLMDMALIEERKLGKKPIV